jgi:hypothetical protein
VSDGDPTPDGLEAARWAAQLTAQAHPGILARPLQQVRLAAATCGEILSAAPCGRVVACRCGGVGNAQGQAQHGNSGKDKGLHFGSLHLSSGEMSGFDGCKGGLIRLRT